MHPQTPDDRPARPERAVGISILGIAALALVAGGCQSYERRPMDLARHSAEYLARTPESPEVRDFAASLAGDGVAQRTGFDIADGLTCPEAEVVGLVFNADLRVARLRAGVTRAGADNAGLWEDPTIGVDLTKIIQSTPEPWKAFATVGLTIPISGRLEIEKQQAGMEHAAELARVAQREWEVRMEIRRAWTDWSAMENRLSTTRDFVASVDQVLAIADRMEQAGEIPRTEARLFRIEKATRLTELGVLELQVLQAELRLKHLMGLSPDAAVVWQPAGIGPGCSANNDDHAPDSGELTARSPAMIVAAAEYEVSERTLELEIRKQYPDLHIGPGYGNEDGYDQVLLGLSVPLPVLNGNRRGIAEARARRELARAGAETTLERLNVMSRTAQVRLESTRRQREAFERDVVPLVDAQYADARQIAQLGEVSTLVLLESLTRRQEAKVRLIDARRDEALARIEMQELSGPPALPPAASPDSLRADQSGAHPSSSH